MRVSSNLPEGCTNSQIEPEGYNQLLWVDVIHRCCDGAVITGEGVVVVEGVSMASVVDDGRARGTLDPGTRYDYEEQGRNACQSCQYGHQDLR